MKMMKFYLIYLIVLLIGNFLRYLPFDGSIITENEIKELFEKAGIDSEYYFFSDSFSDLPYDYDRPGMNNNRRPIHILKPNGGCVR